MISNVAVRSIGTCGDATALIPTGCCSTDLDSGDYAVLDLYEEVPTLYTREQVEVMGQGGARIRCWVYLPTDWANPDSK